MLVQDLYENRERVREQSQIYLDFPQKLDALPNVGRERLQHIGVLTCQALQLVLKPNQIKDEGKGIKYITINGMEIT